MLFIIEGMDNTGKTTTVEWLKNYLRKRYPDNSVTTFHSHADYNPQQYVLAVLREHLVGEAQHIICDRISLVGEVIYGNILRGYTRFDDKPEKISFEDLWKTFLRAVNEPVILIYCRPGKFDMGNKDEYEGVRENQKAILEYYDILMMKLRDIFDEENNKGYRFLTYDFLEDKDYTKLEGRLKL